MPNGNIVPEDEYVCYVDSHTTNKFGINEDQKINPNINQNINQNVISNVNQDTLNIKDNKNNKVNVEDLVYVTEEEALIDQTPKLPPGFRSLSIKEYGKGDSKSKMESVCKRVAEEVFGEKFITVRPDFLRNPETGRNLEIDLYSEKLSIGIEYNGKQHYVWPNIFHKTYEDFIKQVRRDQLKVELCDRHGVYLITVPYNVQSHEVKEYIEYYRPENFSKRLQESSSQHVEIVNIE